jgi:LysM repeat protein
VPGGAPTSYTVKPGDRLFSIGRQFGVNPYAIAQTNRIGPPYTLYPGQVLTIPAGGTGVPTPLPGTGGTYTVQLGDTIYSIGRKLGKSPIAIINANNLINPNRIFPGMVLKIP